MTLISLSNINQNDDATPELFNQRFAAIVNVINGNIDSTNIKDASILYGKLNLSDGDIPIAKVGLTPTTGGTNAGTAGGSTNYIKIGTFLLCWGTTNQLNFPGNANTNYTVTFPQTFALVPSVTFTPRENTAVGNLTPFQQSAPSTTTANLTLGNTTATLGTAKIDWIAIGKSV